VTTFTTNDREEAYKKILAEAPAHIGYEDAVDPARCDVTINIEPIPFAGMVQLQEPKYTKADYNDALFNLGRLMGRIPLEEAKRLEMIVQVITGYTKELEGKQ
jgi:hypothetical protein